MSLSGVHIAFGTATEANVTPGLLSSTLASQTMASAGTATVVAPIVQGGQPVLSIAASAPIFFATGPLPDATNGPRRYYDPATGPLDIFVNSGDKFAWIVA